LEKLIIAIIIAAVSGMFNKKDKESQKKRPKYPKTKNKKDFYKNDDYIEITKQKSKQTTKKAYEEQYNNYEARYDNTTKIVDETQYKSMQNEESATESQEILDIGLSDLQKAIVMSEILSKPLALRKK